MRILYISAGQAPDYMCDMLFHGLRILLGAEVVDVNRMWFMYAQEFAEGGHDRSRLYGRGFTMYGLLEEDSGVDRTDISQKLRTRYFDLVIYGSVHRCRLLLDEVLAFYPPQRVLFVDGEDEPDLVSPLLECGIYFKREIAFEHRDLRPIGFAIPESRIGSVARQKSKLLAFIDPRDLRTYIYHDETDYYGDYAQSLFAVTTKKAGWDCLRHYEILANGCIPYFPDLDDCPPATMVFFPKYELLWAKSMIESRGLEFFDTREGRTTWQGLEQRVEAIFRRHSTTLALAHYVLETAAWLGDQPAGSVLPAGSIPAARSSGLIALPSLQTA
ncbi:MAG TPA: hypothetical protein VEK33_13810 [Terriglobales bacterium]|nr:hypothetical protein [Terriglobales bacterium]